MATGINNLPNPGMSFSPFAILTAEEQNNLVENIESLATGVGVGDGAIPAIKTNFGGNYSTTEVNTGFTWVDGNPIFKKTIACGTLPNSTFKLVPHGITGSFYMIQIGGTVQENATQYFTLPLISASTGNSIAGVGIVGTNVRIHSNATIPTLSSYVTLLYTKV